MPGNVDERVVEMRIDNKQFESGAKTTISTLEKLERALKIKSDSKALDDMAKSVSNFDASPMASSIDKVSEHFNALEIAGRRVIENLTDSIYGFATRTVKNLTIDQVSAGWDKYASKTEAVQSIMAATRDQFDDETEQMEVINKLLDKMMWYTDETSYNFVDMAQNVGKFLAAGVGLGEGESIEDPFNAMMGIASWGASAGAKPTEVSRAMYNISQALSTGKMAQIDWKSIENAGMATLEFKQNVIDTAVELGKLKVWEGVGETNQGIRKFYDASEDMSQAAEDTEKLFDAKSFREQLKSGWFDNEVMSTVFQRYAEFTDALYEGYQETGMEATDLLEILDKARDDMEGFDWNKYADDAGTDVDTLREAIQRLIDTQWEYSEQGFRMGQEAKTWEDTLEATKDAVSSKWMRTFQWVIGDYLEAKEFWTEVTGRMYDAFAAGGDVRNDILEAWYGAGGREAWFSLEEKELGGFWNLLNAFESITGPIRDGFYAAFGIDTQKGIQAVGERLAAISKRFQELTANMGLSEQAQKGLKNIFTFIFTGFKNILSLDAGLLGVVARLLWFIGEVADAVLSLASGEVTLEEVQQRIKDSFDNLLTSLGKVKDHFVDILKSVKSLPASFQKVAHFLKFGELEDYLPVFTKFERFLVKIGQLFPSFSNVLGFLGNAFDRVLAFGSSLSSGLPNTEDVLSTFVYYFEQLKNALKGFKINPDTIKGLFESAGNIIDVLTTAILGNKDTIKVKVKSFFSAIFGIISDVVKDIKISDLLSAAKLGISIGFLGGFLDIVRSLHLVVNEVKSIPEAITDTLGSLQKSFEATSYIKIAVAIGILAASIYALSKVPADDFMRVVLGLGILALVLQKLGKGINIFSGSNNTGDTITKGLKANIKLIPDLAATILALAVAMGVMAAAVVSFKKNNIGGKDLLGPIAILVVTLVSIVGFLYLLKKFNFKDVGKSFGLLITVFAIIGRITKMAKATKNVPWQNLLVLMAGMIGLMLSIALLLRYASGFKKFKDNQILHVAALMLAIGFAIRQISVAMIPLAMMSLGKMLQALAGAGAILLMLGGMMGWMSRLKGGSVGNLLQIAGSMALMAVSIKLLTGPLIAMAALPFSAMMKGVAIIGMLMLMLGGLTAWMSRMNGSKSGGLIAIVGAVALLSLAIAVLLPSIIAFTGFMVALAVVLNGKMIAKLALLSGVMILLGAGLAVAGVGVALFGVGLLGIAASALLFSVAILAIASGLDKLGTAFPQFIQGIIDAGKLMTKENAANIIKGAVAFGLLALAVFGLAKAFGALFGKGDVIAKLGGFGGRLLNGIGTLVRNAGSKIMESLPELLKVLAAVAVVVGLYLIGLIPTLTSTAVQAIITLLESIHQSIRANKDTLEHSIFGMVEVLIEILLDAGTWVFSIIRALIDSGITWIIEQLAATIEKIPGIGDDVARTLRNFANKLPSTEEIMAQWNDQKGTNAEWLQQFVPPAAELQDASQAVTEGIGAGVLNGKHSVDEAIGDVKDSATDIIGQLPEAMESNGKNSIIGLNNGIVDEFNNGPLLGNIDDITNRINLRTRLGLGEHSPSKIAGEAGAFYVIGLAQGIADNAKLPLEAINDTTDPLVEALQNAMLQVATVADDDFEFTPTITPVVDLSNVGYAAGSIGGMFGSPTLNAALSRVSANQANRYSGVSLASSNSGVLSEMQGLGARVDALGEAITNMQIILDTGVLVGATSAKMDARLGVLAARKGRGN